MPLSNAKLILCRPQSGLNDFLCEIERCCRYADQHNRYVLVDSAYKNVRTFHDSFAKYFISTRANLILDGDRYANLFDSMEVYPTALRGRVNNYEVDMAMAAEAVPGQRRFMARDRQTRWPLTFNFAKPYREQLLVHQQPFGGEISLHALRRMRLRDRLVDDLISRLRKLAGPFLGVHIRHTDYQTDYATIIDDIEQRSFDKLFLATDNGQVRDEFSQRFGSRLVTFSALPDFNGLPLHHAILGSSADYYRINSDAVLDLMTLAFASDLVFAKTTQGNYSGYSLLAKNLSCHRDVLRHLVGRRDITLDRWLYDGATLVPEMRV